MVTTLTSWSTSSSTTSSSSPPPSGDGGDINKNLCYATSNLEKVDVLPSRGLNVYSMLLRDKLVLSVGAVLMLEQRLLQDCSGVY